MIRRAHLTSIVVLKRLLFGVLIEPGIIRTCIPENYGTRLHSTSMYNSLRAAAHPQSSLPPKSTKRGVV
jgi:hypothetical protein